MRGRLANRFGLGRAEYDVFHRNAALQCLSWPLPAPETCPSSCAHCYALGGHYNHIRTVRNQFARRVLAREPDRLINVVSRALSGFRGGRAVDANFVRIHESGDFLVGRTPEQNRAYIGAWRRIALNFPEKSFLAFTRCGGVLGPELAELNALPNVTIRPSGCRVDGLAAPAFVHEDALGHWLGIWECPKTMNAGRCEDCRTCWIHPEFPVSFRLHGVRVNVDLDRRARRRARIRETIYEPHEEAAARLRPTAPGEKFCTGCERSLPPESFRKNAAKNDGLSNWCQECCERGEKKRKTP